MRHLALFVLLIVCVPGVSAWDQFKGSPDHAAIAPSNEAVNGSVRWKFITGAEVHGSPAVSKDGTVYASSTDGKLYSIARNGELRWSFDAGSSIWTSPAISNEGKVYFVDETGTLFCLSDKGAEVWRYRARDKVFHSSPAIDDSGNVYFGTSLGALHSVKPDGKPRWLYKTDGFIDSTPAIADDGTVYVSAGDGTLHAIGQLGRAKWSSPFKAQKAISSSPCIGPDGSILFGSEDGFLYSVKPDGTQRWKAKVGEVDLSSPSVDGKRVYIGTMEGDLVCVTDGSVEWRFSTDHSIECSPVVREDGSVIFGSTDKSLYCLDSDGSVKWRFETDGYFGSSSAAFDRDGTIVIGSGDGAIYAIGEAYPSAPLFLIAIPGDKNITLRWSFPENETFDGFIIYRSNYGEDYDEVARTEEMEYTESDLINGVSYSYKVTTLNDIGEGPPSNVATEIPRPPPEEVSDPAEVKPSLGAVDIILIGCVLLLLVAIIWLYRRGRE